jgi:phospholipid/cholesterol/gamma-HCH transport system substrate-binding protein
MLRRLRDRLRDLPSFRDVNQAVLGVVAIVAVALVVIGAFAFGTIDLTTDRYSMSAVFSSTGGIKTGADVRVAGVSVGEVTGTKADFERGQVVLQFEVDRGIDLGPETTAEIASATLLGGYYLRLDGPVEEPYLADLPSDERRIPLDRTMAPISLIGVLSDTTEQVNVLDIEAVNTLLGQLAGATDRNKEVVPELVRHLNTVGAALVDREAQLRDLVANGERIATTLGQRDAELVQLVDAAGILLDTLSQRRDELATVLGSGSDAVVLLAETIEGHRASIDAILADAHILLDGVDRQIGNVNTGLAYAGPIFELLGKVPGPNGGFDVAVEGFVATTDQLRGLLSILFPEVLE